MFENFKKNKLYKKWYFWVGIGIFLFILIPTPPDNDIQSDLPEYTIDSVDSSDIGDKVIRRTINIIISPTSTNEQLLDIAKKEALAYSEKTKVNALTVGFFGKAEEIGKGYTLGSVNYVPDGEWSNAPKITTGDYSSFEFVEDLNRDYIGVYPSN